MNCPACLEKMQRIKKRAIESYSCIFCEGIWVAGESVEKLLKIEDAGISINGLQEECKSSDTSKRTCYDCEGEILKKICIRAVDIDICKNCCGIFFDKGELMKVLPKSQRHSGYRVGPILAGEGLFWIIVSFFL